MLFVVTTAIIYLAWQIVKRWGKLPRHETFNAIVASIVGWAAVVGVVVAFLVPDNYKLIVGALFSVIYYMCVGTYFYSDYRKIHKKPKPKIKFPPLSTETVEPSIPVAKVRTKRELVIRALFVILEAFEAAVFISMIAIWQTFTIDNIPVLTYQNAILFGFFMLGLFFAIDIVRRLRSKKAFFGED